MVRVLRGRVPPGRKPEPFIVPRSPKNTIWINGDNAAFSDVIAPYKLILCKHTSILGQTLLVDLNNNELKQCGLLRHDDSADDKNEIERVALRAIWFMWSDEYEDHHNLDLDYVRTKKADRSVSAVADSPNTGDD